MSSVVYNVSEKFYEVLVLTIRIHCKSIDDENNDDSSIRGQHSTSEEEKTKENEIIFFMFIIRCFNVVTFFLLIESLVESFVECLCRPLICSQFVAV